MIRAAAIMATVAGPVAAQNFPSVEDYLGGDMLEIRDSADGHWAEVYYANSAERMSGGGTYTFEREGVTVEVTIEIGGPEINYAERCTVRVLDAGLIAIPETIDVIDGEHATIIITRPMF